LAFPLGAVSGKSHQNTILIHFESLIHHILGLVVAAIGLGRIDKGTVQVEEEVCKLYDKLFTSIITDKICFAIH
jgi:hypothetical protein